MVQFTLTSYGHTRGHWSLACGLAANKWIKHSLVAALIDNFWHLVLFLLSLMGSCPSTSFFFELWINSAALQIFCNRKREYAERENVEWCPTLVTLSDAEHSKVSHKEGGSLSLLTAFATSVTSSSESQSRQGSRRLIRTEEEESRRRWGSIEITSHGWLLIWSWASWIKLPV